MLQVNEAQDIINKRISDLCYPASPERLYEPIRYVLRLGGKRIRPVFTLLACNLFSDDVVRAVEPAVGLEIFHNFTLLHDDIMAKITVAPPRTMSPPAKIAGREDCIPSFTVMVPHFDTFRF